MAADAMTVNASEIMQLMQQHNIDPIPDNYEVLFTYKTKKNSALNHEIDTLLKEKMAFTEDIMTYLHTKYIDADDARLVGDTTASAKHIVQELATVVASYSGQTKDQQAALARDLENIGPDANIKDVIQSMVGHMKSVMQSGNELQQQLEKSQKEIDQLKANLAQITTESEKDFLTGVYNRKALDMHISRVVDECKSIKAPLCLLMIDIDHFKQFNDRFGHLVGDEVIKIVARTLMDTVKGKDIVGRYGGEEFCVLLPDTPVGGATAVGEAICKAIAKKELKRRDTGENYGQITVSIGVAMHRDKDTIPTFLKRADDAMYNAKQAGRNQVSHFSE